MTDKLFDFNQDDPISRRRVRSPGPGRLIALSLLIALCVIGLTVTGWLVLKQEAKPKASSIATRPPREATRGTTGRTTAREGDWLKERERQEADRVRKEQEKLLQKKQREAEWLQKRNQRLARQLAGMERWECEIMESLDSRIRQETLNLNALNGSEYVYLREHYDLLITPWLEDQIRRHAERRGVRQLLGALKLKDTVKERMLVIRFYFLNDILKDDILRAAEDISIHGYAGVSDGTRDVIKAYPAFFPEP